MRSVFFPAGGGGGREARVRWIRLLGLTPWTTTTAASSNGGVGGVGGGSGGGGNGGGGSSRALSIPDFHPPSPGSNLFLFPPSFSRRRLAAVLPLLNLSRSLSLSAVSFSLPHASVRCFSFF